MIYGQGVRAPALRAAQKLWRELDANRRLALVEQSLKPANDTAPVLPIAL